MPAYQQMGHHSENLLYESELSCYRGAILSPVNYEERGTAAQVSRVRDQLDDFDLIFDPQLYYPNTERGVLDRWAYFPDDVDTADLSSERWWDSLLDRLSATATQLSVDAVCSPGVVPRTFKLGYYTQARNIAEKLRARLLEEDIRVLQTALVHLPELATAGQPEAIASVLSGGPVEEVFLVALGGGEPRRELSDTESVKGFMRLVAALESASIAVLVGFSSSDVLLWKAAGASSCATGKFFNLRRFTSSRFEEPSGGGGQLPYWFEENLLAFLRESDLIRVREYGLLASASLNNPIGEIILERLDAQPQNAWLGLAWRQWMWWFADIESRISEGQADVGSLLRQAERNWLELDDADILMEEPRNDGSWIRPWRRAVLEYQR